MTLQAKITETQNMRPRGRPQNNWPSVPMTNEQRQFWDKKEKKETQLRQEKYALEQQHSRERTVLTNQKRQLQMQEQTLESKMRIIKIKLH